MNDELRCRVITDWNDIDTTALDAMVARAWQGDYVDSVRPDLGRVFMTHMTRDTNWFGSVCETADGAPVGFELAMPRALFVRDQPMQAYYVTAFSADPDRRRQGIGRAVLETINEEAFKRRGADLIFSTFEDGKAGSPTVQATFDRQGLAVRRFHRSPLFVLRADAAAGLTPSAEQPSVSRVYVDKSSARVRSSAGASADVVREVADLEALVRQNFDVAFAMTESFVQHYLRADTGAAGSYWFSFDDGAWCWMTCAEYPLAFNEASVGTSLMIQTVVSEGCDGQRLGACVSRMASKVVADGHRALLAYDYTGVPDDVFTNLGFERNGGFYLSARGAPDKVRCFEGVRAPFFVDFT